MRFCQVGHHNLPVASSFIKSEPERGAGICMQRTGHPNAMPPQGFKASRVLDIAYQVCNCWQPQAKMSWTCHEVSVRRARCNTVPALGIVGFIRLMGDILHPLGPVGILMLLQTLRFMGYYRLVQDFVHQLFCDRREEVGFMLQD